MLFIWCKKYFDRMLLWPYNYCAIVSHLSIYASWVSDLVESDMAKIQLRNNAQNYWTGENSKTFFDPVKFDKSFLTHWGFLTLARCVFDMNRLEFLAKKLWPGEFFIWNFQPGEIFQAYVWLGDNQSCHWVTDSGSIYMACLDRVPRSEKWIIKVS